MDETVEKRHKPFVAASASYAMRPLNKDAQRAVRAQVQQYHAERFLAQLRVAADCSALAIKLQNCMEDVLARYTGDQLLRVIETALQALEGLIAQPKEQIQLTQHLSASNAFNQLARLFEGLRTRRCSEMNEPCQGNARGVEHALASCVSNLRIRQEAAKEHLREQDHEICPIKRHDENATIGALCKCITSCLKTTVSLTGYATLVKELSQLVASCNDTKTFTPGKGDGCLTASVIEQICASGQRLADQLLDGGDHQGEQARAPETSAFNELMQALTAFQIDEGATNWPDPAGDFPCPAEEPEVGDTLAMEVQDLHHRNKMVTDKLFALRRKCRPAAGDTGTAPTRKSKLFMLHSLESKSLLEQARRNRAQGGQGIQARRRTEAKIISGSEIQHQMTTSWQLQGRIEPSQEHARHQDSPSAHAVSGGEHGKDSLSLSGDSDLAHHSIEDVQVTMTDEHNKLSYQLDSATQDAVAVLASSSSSSSWISNPRPVPLQKKVFLHYRRPTATLKGVPSSSTPHSACVSCVHAGASKAVLAALRAQLATEAGGSAGRVQGTADAWGLWRSLVLHCRLLRSSTTHFYLRDSATSLYRSTGDGLDCRKLLLLLNSTGSQALHLIVSCQERICNCGAPQLRRICNCGAPQLQIRPRLFLNPRMFHRQADATLFAGTRGRVEGDAGGEGQGEGGCGAAHACSTEDDEHHKLVNLAGHAAPRNASKSSAVRLVIGRLTKRRKAGDRYRGRRLQGLEQSKPLEQGLLALDPPTPVERSGANTRGGTRLNEARLASSASTRRSVLALAPVDALSLRPLTSSTGRGPACAKSPNVLRLSQRTRWCTALMHGEGAAQDFGGVEGGLRRGSREQGGRGYGDRGVANAWEVNVVRGMKCALTFQGLERFGRGAGKGSSPQPPKAVGNCLHTDASAIARESADASASALGAAFGFNSRVSSLLAHRTEDLRVEGVGWGQEKADHTMNP